MSLPSPSTLLGIPEFDEWYPGQCETFTKLIDWFHSPTRFIGVACPTGSGKSILSLLTARMTGARTVIVTATKGLQYQYAVQGTPLGAVVVVGQNNFSCTLAPSLRADEGPCHEGMACPVKESCPYRVQLKRALESQIVITNYAYYLAQTNFSSGLGDIGLLILDEAHSAFSAMENYLTIFLSRLDIEPMGIHFPESADRWGAWQSWAEVSHPTAQDSVSRIESDIKVLHTKNQPVPGHVSRAYRVAKSVAARLERLSSVSEDWVIQRTHHGFRFVPKWVSNYDTSIFQKVPKIVLMSAILSHKTCDYLGVPSDNKERSWIESESYFPPENTPIWHVPTARINHRLDDFGATVWVSRIDQIIQRRLDRKGIVFTVSYERARLLLQRSRFKNIMLSHSTGDVVSVVNKFKNMPAPAVLVSPTVTTGWDFPAEQFNIRYLIIGKIPYPDTRDEVVKARSEEDKDWTSYLAMDVFVQESGRATRSSTDRVECLVVDDNAKWFMFKYASYAPKWFRARWRGSLETVPDPLV